jgi:hypothetical protein
MAAMGGTTFDVFIEAPPGVSRAEIERLVDGMASRFKIPRDHVVRSLMTGRVRVSSGVKRESADRLVRVLTGIGLVCLCGESGNAPSATPAAHAEPAPTTAEPASSAARAGADALPRVAGKKPADVEALMRMLEEDDARTSMAVENAADVAVFGDIEIGDLLDEERRSPRR